MNVRMNFCWEFTGEVELSSFCIDNPPVLLNDNDPVHFEWADYIDDPKQVEYLESIREETHFKVHLVVKIFSRDQLTIEYVLRET